MSGATAIVVPCGAPARQPLAFIKLKHHTNFLIDKAASAA
jgi:hypothetical protein